VISSGGRWRRSRGRLVTDPRPPKRGRRPDSAALVALAAALLLGPGAGPAPVAAQSSPGDDPVVEEIRRRVEQLREQGSISVGGVVTVSGDRLAEVYEDGAFRPLWTRNAADELFRFAGAVDADGLDPRHYHVAALARLDSMPASGPPAVAEAELLRTDAFLALASDLGRGRVDPSTLDASWHVERPGTRALGADSLAEAIVSGRILRTLDAFRPQHPIYRGMMRALADHRAIEARGGWETLPEGTFLALDSVAPVVVQLRRRLICAGDLPPGADSLDTRFDHILEEGVRRFQHRHGLNQDGVVGAATLAALNVPAGERVAQLRANLERARWVLRSLADTLVAVNIAGQMVYVIEGGEVALEMRAVVGRDYTRTPVFSAPMRYLVLNPTWTVPRSINGEILANIRRDPTYLDRQRFEVLDSRGVAVDPAGIDFQRYSGGSFPWVFRQRPGPTNALGVVKFMFPNEFNVYLHDTPSRSLFAREERLFSHGCIRIEDPLGLARFLLGDWDQERLAGAIATGATRTVNLPTPVPVLVLYWTAAADLHGDLHFYRDIYRRDVALLDALARPHVPD
jgi:L,D-transpeptidase YcbB